MSNFYRVLRLCLRSRWSVAAAILCALTISMLWCTNIGTIYPFVKVVFRGESAHDWIEGEIVAAEGNVATLAANLDAIKQQRATADPDVQSALDKNIALKSAEHSAAILKHDSLVGLEPTIKAYFPEGPYQTLLFVVCFLAIGTLLKDLLLVVNGYLVARVTALAAFDLRQNFYRRTLNMNLRQFNENGTNALLSRFTHDMDSVTKGMNQLLGKVLVEPLKVIACLTVAAWISWQLLLVCLIVLPITAYLISRLASSIKRANRRAMEEMSELYQILGESFSGIKVVKAFTMERSERKRFHRVNKNYFFKSLKIGLYGAFIRPASELMGVSTICLALLTGGYLVLNQQTHLFGIRMSADVLSAELLMFFYAMLAGVSDPVRKITSTLAAVQRAAAAADRVYEFFDREPEIRDAENPHALPRHHHAIELSQVHFSYDGETKVLNGIDLKIPFGETLAIVGTNGCGKSTLANLIPRFYDSVEGAVRIDGVDVRDVRLRDLRRQIGIVTQETVLFDDTILNNIRYGKPLASREEAMDAARRAHAHDFIETACEDGYETIVGEKGSRLSGGQRQRIALARAILRDPAILILDEATSQIDPESEQLIHQVLAEFMQQRTTVIVTHRRSTLDLADRIAVMDSGKIVDIGTFDEVQQRSELFSRLFSSELRRSA